MRRREFLKATGVWAAALAGTAGCGRLRAGAALPARPRTPLAVQLVPPLGAGEASPNYTDDLAQLVAPVLAAYNARQSEAEVSLFSPAGAEQPLPVAVVPLAANAPFMGIGRYAVPAGDISGLMRQTNWNSAPLLAGFLDALSWHGALAGVPYNFAPTGVQIAVADLRRLGFSLPPDSWTDSDFASACAALQAAPGRTASVVACGGEVGFTWPQVWTGWVWGHGGALLDADGRIVLTDPGAIDGVGALIEAMRAARPNMCALAGEMVFVAAGRRAVVPAGEAAGAGLWAFPEMPAGRVIPTIVEGLGINPKYPYPELAAALLAWLTGPAGQAEMVAVGYPTVLTHGPAGSDAWTQAYPAGFDHGGLEVPAAAVRPIPWQINLLTDLLGSAMWQAFDATGASQLESLLATAEQKANAALALQGQAQAAYLKPFQKWYTLDVPPMTIADAQCFLGALPGNAPSPYASAVPSGASAAPPGSG